MLMRPLLCVCSCIVLKLFTAAWRHSWLRPLPSSASCLLLWIFTESHRLICSATVVFLLQLLSNRSMIRDHEWRPIWPLSRSTGWRQTQGCYSSFLSISRVSHLGSNVCVHVCDYDWFRDSEFCNVGAAFEDTDLIQMAKNCVFIQSFMTSCCCIA